MAERELDADEEVRLRKERDRGNRARLVLEDPLIVEAFELIEANFIAKWRNSAVDDAEGREECWRYIHTLAEFKRFFTVAMDSGKMAHEQLSTFEKLKREAKEFFRAA